MKILLVDDDKGILKSLHSFLSENGHSIIVGESAEEALEKLNREPFNMVISDIRLPKLNGIDFLKEIKRTPSFNHLPVILITGHGEIKDAVEALKCGAYDYLTKPLNIEELILKIDKIAEYIHLKEENYELTTKFDEEINEVKVKYDKEIERLKKLYLRNIGLDNIGIFSDKIKQILNFAEKLHFDRTVPVLIEGETGTGKEIIARYIHYLDGSVNTPFIALNSATISPTLFESELFGYEGGAYTGSNSKGQKGKFELADSGTILLDEISELTPEIQAKLLRVIQEKEFYRVGGIKIIKPDIRIICTTNENIAVKVKEGKFRQDLFYRLSVGYCKIPPLRERKEEIIPFCDMFLKEFAEQKKKKFKYISEESKKLLLDYEWKGNIRELKNVIERVVLIYDDEFLRPYHLNFLVNDSLDTKLGDQDLSTFICSFLKKNKNLNLEEIMLDIVKKTLELNEYNKTATAESLGLTRDKLYTFIKRLGKDAI